MNDANSISSGFVDEPLSVASYAGIEQFYESASGYNSLYRCERFGRLHVLKCLKTVYQRVDFYEQALRKEFVIGYQLEHPHICRTLGWENLPSLGHCILLEYLDGVTLKERMDQGRLSQPLVYKWIKELCEALHYLHSKQVIHRDLKPSNVLITHNGDNCKLIDFSLSDCDDYDILKLPAGTRYYLAPEALQEHVTLDSRADIYSLGVIIGELATLLKDRHLAAISRRCTQRSKEKRYASALEVLEALQHQPRSKAVYVGVGLAGVVLLAGLAYGYVTLTTPQTQPLVTAFPTFGNRSINETCRRILAAERLRVQQTDAAQTDSVQFMQRLKEAFDADYPLAVQRQSKTYQVQWQAVQHEAEHIIAGQHH